MPKPPRDLPAAFKPLGQFTVQLKQGPVQVALSQPIFRSWPKTNPRPADTKGNKPLVDLDGEMLFAELALLTLLIRDGWEGRWIDNYPLPPTFRLRYWDATLNKLPRLQADHPLTSAVRDLYSDICTRAGDVRGGGAWDVIAWRGDEMLFIEAKRRSSSDRLRDEQRRWLEAALDLGVPLGCFVFAEWVLS